MSGSPEPMHPEHVECRNVIVAENGARLCADTGIVIDDEPLDVGKDWRAYDVDEMLRRIHAQPASALTGTIITDDDELAVLHAQLVRRDTELLATAEAVLREMLGDDWNRLSDETRKNLVYEVKRAFDIVRAHGYRLSRCTAEYIVYIVAKNNGFDNVTTACKRWRSQRLRVIAWLLAKHGYVVKVDAREETLKHVMRCAEKLRLDADAKRLALNLARHIVEVHRKPSVMAAAAIYLAVRILQRSVRQATIAATCSVSDASIRNALHEFLKHYDVIVLLGA